MTTPISSPSNNSLHSFYTAKPTKFIAEDFQPNWLSRHVTWLKEKQHSGHKVNFIALVILESLVLTLSIGGILFLYRGWQESKRQDAKAIFLQRVNEATLPCADIFEVKTKTCAFNHVQDFIIHDNIIWVRKRNTQNPIQETWKPLFFDGMMTNDDPYSIDSDGANLIVTTLGKDHKQVVHYKKVLKEFRHTQIKGMQRQHFEQAGVDLENDVYIAIDKSERNNWKDKWFSLYYIHPVVNFFTGKRLEIGLNTPWAISHHGRYNNYLEDRMGQKHLVGVGTTTLYVLDSEGQKIYKNDPWLPKHIKISLPLPETTEMSYKAENIKASASAIMAIGYEIHRKDPTTSTFQVYTCFSDLDLDGLDFFNHEYAYFKHPTDPKIWVRPLDTWKAHPLNLQDSDFITHDISIIQTGEGNSKRQLRILGQQGKHKGIYFKNINESDWHFHPLDNEHTQHISQETALPLKKPNSKPFCTTVHDYIGQSIQFYRVSSNSLSVRLKNFGEHSSSSTFALTIDNRKYKLELHKKKTFKNVLGFKGDAYELVIPEHLHQNATLQKVFNKKNVIPLSIIENQTNLTIQDAENHLFKMTFAIEGIF